MIVQHMIEEIEGIMLLLSIKPNTKVLTALSGLPAKEVKEYRNSLAKEWEVLHKGKKILLED